MTGEQPSQPACPTISIQCCDAVYGGTEDRVDIVAGTTIEQLIHIKYPNILSQLITVNGQACAQEYELKDGDVVVISRSSVQGAGPRAQWRRFKKLIQDLGYWFDRQGKGHEIWRNKRDQQLSIDIDGNEVGYSAMHNLVANERQFDNTWNMPRLYSLLNKY